MPIPYPMRVSNGDITIVKNAAMVVTVVRRRGSSKEFIQFIIATFLLFTDLSSRKNFVTT